jgi:hypothetical protein
MSQPGQDSFEPYPHARPESGPSQPYPEMPAYGSGQDYPETPAYGSSQEYGAGQQYGTAQEHGANAYAVNPYQSSYGGHSAYGLPAEPHPQAVAALVLGLIGVSIMPPVGIIGMVLGGRARRQIDERPYAYTNRGIATAGYVLGIISLVFTALWTLFIVLILVGVAVG